MLSKALIVMVLFLSLASCGSNRVSEVSEDNPYGYELDESTVEFLEQTKPVEYDSVAIVSSASHVPSGTVLEVGESAYVPTSEDDLSTMKVTVSSIGLSTEAELEGEGLEVREGKKYYTVRAEVLDSSDNELLSRSEKFGTDKVEIRRDEDGNLMDAADYLTDEDVDEINAELDEESNQYSLIFLRSDGERLDSLLDGRYMDLSYMRGAMLPLLIDEKSDGSLCDTHGALRGNGSMLSYCFVYEVDEGAEIFASWAIPQNNESLGPIVEYVVWKTTS